MKTLITFIKNIKSFYRLCKKSSDENCEFIIKKYQAKDGIAEMNSAYQATFESVYKNPPIEKSYICTQSNPLCDLEPTTCGISIDCSTFEDIAKGERCFICGRETCGMN